MRADLLVSNKLNISRNKAAELLASKSVLINDKSYKASANVDESSKVELLNEVYVSRAAYKLKGFLDDFREFSVANKNCLDVGSSTGGFTQILLLNNAKSVSCVDVGSEQLDKSLREDKRVIVYENTDVRDFNKSGFDVVVCDLSFISINYVINDLLRLSDDYIILLFKPQFEVGKDIKRTKTGVIKDEKAILNSLLEFEKSLSKLNLKLIKKEKSKLSGKEGNYEYFYAFRK